MIACITSIVAGAVVTLCAPADTQRTALDRHYACELAKLQFDGAIADRRRGIKGEWYVRQMAMNMRQDCSQ